TIMKSLQTIQKTFRVLQILTKIAMIFGIVGAVLCAVGCACVVAWHNGGQALTLFGQPVVLYDGGEGVNQTLAVLLSDLVMLTAEAILLAFAYGYFKTEQAEGTPFTENGANLLKKLGIRCIYLPIVSIVISSVIQTYLDAEKTGHIGNLPGLVTGITLILASLIFRYGAELEKREVHQ
ncbi:MAG: hypothetical protein ACI4I8_03125, partial [Oscillospiraceae bacterium]